jgi:hypothetical protein
MLFSLFRAILWIIKAQIVVAGANYGLSPKRSLGYRVTYYLVLAAIITLTLRSSRAESIPTNPTTIQEQHTHD